MSDFLVLKSTEEQKAEGVEQPIDTAFIDDRDGMPTLKAVFDIRHFRPEDVQLNVEDNQLVLVAQCMDDTRECSIFKKTMIRRLDLPKYVEAKTLHCSLSEDGVLTVEMPFHLPAQRRPAGPGVVPIVTGEDGRRKICFSVLIGPDFTSDDVKVDVLEGRQLQVIASYDAEIGVRGSEVTKRRLERLFRLPERMAQRVESVDYSLNRDGFLNFEILLKPEEPYKCDITTEELTTGETEDGEEIEVEEDEGENDDTLGELVSVHGNRKTSQTSNSGSN